MNDWKPIETAPRDGTPLDLWHRDGFRTVDVWWAGDCWSDVSDDNDYTHWMLPPDPPVSL